jgi:carbonic anhydrase
MINSIEQNVRDDLEWLKSAPLIRKELAERARGFVYDIKTGRVYEV